MIGRCGEVEVGAIVISRDHARRRGVKLVRERQLSGDRKTRNARPARRLWSFAIEHGKTVSPPTVVITRVSKPINAEILAVGIVLPGSVTEAQQRNLCRECNRACDEPIAT